MSDLGNVSPDVLITLVHGTWGQGFRWLAFLQRRPRWFEDGSEFRKRLLQELSCQSIHAEIKAFMWDGANSILRRDAAAEQLKGLLVEQREQHPDATRLVIELVPKNWTDGLALALISTHEEGSDDDEQDPPESRIGIQGEGGAGGAEGRADGGGDRREAPPSPDAGE